MQDFLYHGSKISGIKTLELKAHGAVGGEKVVFATPDKVFALAMIYGTGEQLAIDYADGKIYLDEIEKGALELLNQPGYLYRVKSDSFINDNRLIGGEMISRNPVQVEVEKFIPNILEELKKEKIKIVSYEQVPESMAKRKSEQPAKEYTKNRFRSLE